MTDTHIDDTATLTTHYLGAWNADDPADRRRHIEAAFATDAHFSDPLAELVGHDALEGFITQVRGTYPSSRFALLSDIDTHHNVARWTWVMMLSDGNVRMIGHDVVVLGADGRIADFVGFFGPLGSPA